MDHAGPFPRLREALRGEEEAGDWAGFLNFLASWTLAQIAGMVQRSTCTVSRVLLCAALLAAPLAVSAFSVMPGAPGLRGAPGRARLTSSGRAGRGRGAHLVVAQTRTPGDGTVEKSQLGKGGNLWEKTPAPILQKTGTRPDITKLSPDVKEVLALHLSTRLISLSPSLRLRCWLSPPPSLVPWF